MQIKLYARVYAGGLTDQLLVSHCQYHDIIIIIIYSGSMFTNNHPIILIHVQIFAMITFVKYNKNNHIEWVAVGKN